MIEVFSPTGIGLLSYKTAQSNRVPQRKWIKKEITCWTPMFIQIRQCRNIVSGLFILLLSHHRCWSWPPWHTLQIKTTVNIRGSTYTLYIKTRFYIRGSPYNSMHVVCTYVSFISIHVNLDRKKRIEPLTINPNIQFINHIYFTKFMWSTSTSYNSMHVVCTYVSIHQHPRELGQKKEDRTPYYKSKHTVHKSHLLY